MRAWMLLAWLLLASPLALAADPCAGSGAPPSRLPSPGASYAGEPPTTAPVPSPAPAAGPVARLVAIACAEHRAWYRPFIDRNGRLASATVSEAESSALADGSPVWRRVAAYWQQSGLLGQVTASPGAGECAYAATDPRPSSACRGFVVDTPWSAAFVSWVMTRAGMPGFRPSASHVGYVRDAVLQPQGSAWDALDPLTAVPGAGDLLCYVRVPGRTYGHAGLLAALRADGGGLQMHCDIVVAANPDHDATAYLVGGNVQQGVTMRLLPLNRAGRLWNLATTGGAPMCSPDNDAACSFNRQDWAVLLKLKPAAALAALPAPSPAAGWALPDTAPAPACCVNCVVGAGVPRCPRPGGG